MVVGEKVKYLNLFEQYFDYLYTNDIEKLKLGVEYMFDGLPMAQEFSQQSFGKRYITKILLTCLNQIVASSVDYLTSDHNGKNMIFWKQPLSTLIGKLDKCIQLKVYVIECYNKMSNKIIAEGRGLFQILYNTTFGNFILFFHRIGQVSE